MISIINQYNKVWDMLDNTEAPGLLAHHVCFGGELCDSLGLLEGGVRGKRWCECSTKTKKVLVHGAWYHGGAIAVSAVSTTVLF